MRRLGGSRDSEKRRFRRGVEKWSGLEKDMEFLVKFGELEWTVSEVAFMGQLFQMMANFRKRCEVYLAIDGG